MLLASLLEPGIGQLLIILVIALLFFGHKLPQVARSLGSSVSEFKRGVKQGEEEAKDKAPEQEHSDDTPPKK